jgi:hypothetical protein
LFYWVESVQSYNVDGWDYITKLHEYVDGGFVDTSFIDAVSGIVNRGCHNPPCGTLGTVDGNSDRRENFRKVMAVFNVSYGDSTVSLSPSSPVTLPTENPTTITERGGTPGTEPSAAPGTNPVNGKCGDGNRGNGICDDPNLCCSKWGWCGSLPEHCGFIGEDLTVTEKPLASNATGGDNKNSTRDDIDCGDACFSSGTLNWFHWSPLLSMNSWWLVLL